MARTLFVVKTIAQRDALVKRLGPGTITCYEPASFKDALQRFTADPNSTAVMLVAYATDGWHIEDPNAVVYADASLSALRLRLIRLRFTPRR